MISIAFGRFFCILGASLAKKNRNKKKGAVHRSFDVYCLFCSPPSRFKHHTAEQALEEVGGTQLLGSYRISL